MNAAHPAASSAPVQTAGRADSKDAESVRRTVRDGYARIARGGGACCGGSAPADAPAKSVGCCTAERAPRQAERIGYDASDLDKLPETADMGLSCGNPTAIASLQPGEVVLDLGSGGGFDCFIAGPRVGPKGRVIGVDMTPEMLDRARAGLAAYGERSGLNNVEFRLGEIEHLPVADASIDVVLSNCVINLSPDKPQVWREIARVLRPGGRVAVSDIALLRDLPPAVTQMVEALCGCVAGAVRVEQTREMMQAAGLTDIRLTPKPGYVAALAEMQDPLYRTIAQHLPACATPADFITSLDISARK